MYTYVFFASILIWVTFLGERKKRMNVRERDKRPQHFEGIYLFL